MKNFWGTTVTVLRGFLGGPGAHTKNLAGVGIYSHTTLPIIVLGHGSDPRTLVFLAVYGTKAVHIVDVSTTCPVVVGKESMSDFGKRNLAAWFGSDEEGIVSWHNE